MINFCAIAPINYLHLVEDRPVHLLLAHLIESNLRYRQFYIDLKKKNPNVVYIGDNSAFELYKQGKPMFPADKLVDVYSLVGADYVVLSDYPGQKSEVTISSAIDQTPAFKNAGFKTFFCPQSEVGNFNDLMQGFQWAIDNKDIDLIGVSILACPNAFGIRQTKYNVGSVDQVYRLQRYLSRWEVLNRLDSLNLLGPQTIKRFHCLGMVDGPNEIKLLKQYEKYIYSIDSSSPIWHGINNICYDKSPTGLIKGKLESEVNFECDYKVEREQNCLYNISLIDSLCGDRDEV